MNESPDLLSILTRSSSPAAFPVDSWELVRLINARGTVYLLPVLLESRLVADHALVWADGTHTVYQRSDWPLLLTWQTDSGTLIRFLAAAESRQLQLALGFRMGDISPGFDGCSVDRFIQYLKKGKVSPWNFAKACEFGIGLYLHQPQVLEIPIDVYEARRFPESEVSVVDDSTYLRHCEPAVASPQMYWLPKDSRMAFCRQFTWRENELWLNLED